MQTISNCKSMFRLIQLNLKWSHIFPNPRNKSYGFHKFVLIFRWSISCDWDRRLNKATEYRISVSLGIWIRYCINCGKKFNVTLNNNVRYDFVFFIYIKYMDVCYLPFFSCWYVYVCFSVYITPNLILLHKPRERERESTNFEIH